MDTLELNIAPPPTMAGNIALVRSAAHGHPLIAINKAKDLCLYMLIIRTDHFFGGLSLIVYFSVYAYLVGHGTTF